ncbi:MAG: hypothetical protein ABSH30_07145 [Acidimicrobiales bacterium]|jgi:hypothetical protein
MNGDDVVLLVSLRTPVGKRDGGPSSVQPADLLGTIERGGLGTGTARERIG